MSRRTALAAASIVLAIGLVHGPSLLHEFTWDDGYLVLDNPEVRDLGAIPGMFVTTWGSGTEDRASRDMNRAYYRPVALVSIALQFAVMGADATGFHAVNLLFHALAGLALFSWLRRMLGRSVPDDDPVGASWADLAALLLAVAWSVHPVHVESVNVAAYRSTTLGGLFTFATLALLAPRPRDRDGGRTGTGSLLAAMACAALALWSKETSVILPALVAVQDLLTGRAGRRRIATTWIPMGLLAIAYLGLRHQTTAASDMRFFEGISTLQALALVPRMFHFYLGLCIAPWPLSPFYDWSIVGSPQPSLDLATVAGTVLLIGLATAALALVRRRPVAALGLAVFAIGLLPVSHAVPFVVGVADRFLYVPLAGLLLAGGDAFLAVRTSDFSRRILGTTAIVGLLGLATLSACKQPDWRNDETILLAVVRDHPASINGNLGLARYYLARGRSAEAVAPLKEVVRLYPSLATGHGLLAAALGRSADYAGGRRVLRDAPMPQAGLPSAVEIARTELMRTGDIATLRRLGL